MTPEVIASLVTGGLNFASNLGNALYSNYRNKLNDIREDTAIQRRANDYEAAGLSRLNAVGNGAGSSVGSGLGLSPSNSALQQYYDLKNQKEAYKQNQLYTDILANQAQQSDLQSAIDNFNAEKLFGIGSIYTPHFDKLGNNNPYRKNDFTLVGHDDYSRQLDYLRQAGLNQSLYDYNQSIFDNRTRTYRNTMDLINTSIAPVLDIGGTVGSFLRINKNFSTNKNFNTNQNFNRSTSTNYNYNYRNR